MPTWLGALGSIAAAWFAAVTAVTAIVVAVVALSTYRDSIKERQQALDQAHRSQANQVSVWITGPGKVTFKNASLAAVYSVVATCVNVNKTDPDARTQVSQGNFNLRAVVPVLAPGESPSQSVPGWGGGAAGRRDGYELAFTDSSGTHWVRSARGRLREISVFPFDYYGFHPPYPW